MRNTTEFFKSLYNNMSLRTVILKTVLLVPIFLSHYSWADWTVFGINNHCSASYDQPIEISDESPFMGECPLVIGDGNGLPKGGTYYVAAFATNEPGIASGNDTYTVATSNLIANMPSGKQLADLTYTLIPSGNFYANPPRAYLCYAIRQRDTSKYYKFNNTPQGCLTVPDGGGNLPPGPDFVTCNLNNGSALDVSLGDIDRSQIGVIPGTTAAIKKPLAVTCTGDGTSTFSIKFQYETVSAAGNEYIHSSANGLSLAMSLNDVAVDTSKTFTRTYGAGTQTEMLGFEPIRDSAVTYADIPTGAFTASAVMILTRE
ncbi:TPA: hypothetical protein ACPYV0_004435 [Citrobacter amalonaticus]